MRLISFILFLLAGELPTSVLSPLISTLYWIQIVVKRAVSLVARLLPLVLFSFWLPVLILRNRFISVLAYFRGIIWLQFETQMLYATALLLFLGARFWFIRQSCLSSSPCLLALQLTLATVSMLHLSNFSFPPSLPQFSQFTAQIVSSPPQPPTATLSFAP